uniref:Uncharacterized protein n=1 Tax=Anopheles minimus TaxID=112268 RepID=A0A182WBV9_9DIPT
MGKVIIGKALAKDSRVPEGERTCSEGYRSDGITLQGRFKETHLCLIISSSSSSSSSNSNRSDSGEWSHRTRTLVDISINSSGSIIIIVSTIITAVVASRGQAFGVFGSYPTLTRKTIFPERFIDTSRQNKADLWCNGHERHVARVV